VARLNIPVPNREGLSAFLALDKKQFDNFIKQIGSLPATVDIASQISDTVSLPDVKKPDLDKLIRSVISLALVRWTQEADLDGFLEDIMQAIALFNPSIATSDARERLRTLFNIDPLTVGSKAVSILTDYQRTMHGAKVLTDVRYVFQQDAEEEPYGAVIVHLLKLSYHENAEHMDLFVAMDEKDLSQLEAVLKRARIKAQRLQAKLKTTGTRYLGSDKVK
jgi:hypothetical protein